MKDHNDRTPADLLAAAARAIVEGVVTAGTTDRRSTTVFLGSTVRLAVIEGVLGDAATSAGFGAVAVRHAKGRAHPSAAASFLEDGRRVDVDNLVLWSGDIGRAVLVPRSSRHDFHLAIGPSGLERRPGRLASDLAAGIGRATARLRDAARSLGDKALPHLRILV